MFGFADDARRPPPDADDRRRSPDGASARGARTVSPVRGAASVSTRVVDARTPASSRQSASATGLCGNQIFNPTSMCA